MSGEFDKIIERIEEKALKQGRIEGIEEGEKKGVERGKSESKKEVARNMLADGSIPLDKIAKFSGLTIAEVESLKQSSIR